MGGPERTSKSPVEEVQAVQDGEGDPYFLQDVAAFYLALRGRGHFLAPTDTALIQEWEASGLALHTVLRGLHLGSERLVQKNRPIRGLRDLKAAVDREGRSSVARARFRSPTSGSSGAASSVSGPDPRVVDAFREAQCHHIDELLGAETPPLPAMREALLETRRDLVALDQSGDWQHSGPIGALLATGRRLYEQILKALPPEDLQNLDQKAVNALAGFPGEMSDAFRIDTLKELKISFLRSQFRLLEPSMLLSLWDE